MSQADNKNAIKFRNFLRILSFICFIASLLLKPEGGATDQVDNLFRLFLELERKRLRFAYHSGYWMKPKHFPRTNLRKQLYQQFTDLRRKDN